MTDDQLQAMTDRMLGLLDAVPDTLQWGEHVYTDCPICGAAGQRKVMMEVVWEIVKFVLLLFVSTLSTATGGYLAIRRLIEEYIRNVNDD